jgi:hypothetical protein
MARRHMLVKGLVATLLLLHPLTSCAAVDAGDDAQERRQIEEFDVVKPTSEFGQGSRVEITGARLLKNGSLHVLASGFACGTPSRLEVDETESEVLVAAWGARYDDGLCTANIVFWYIPVPTAEPLGSRDLRTEEGSRIEVADCESEPSHPRCKE